MKIIHIMFGGGFNEDMSYQGNFLPKENAKSGHEVWIIAGTNKWNEEKLISVCEETKTIYGNVTLIRLKFVKFFNKTLTNKIKKTRSLMRILKNIKPDLIFFHDVQGCELLTVRKYIIKNPNVKFYIDSHSDRNNSATNVISKYFLHKLFYKNIIKKCTNYVQKIFYVSEEAKDFLIDFYKISDKLLEFLPLGGNPISRTEKIQIRIRIRKTLGIAYDDIVLVHSGKMNTKKCTLSIIDSFLKLDDKRLKLLIIGVFSSEIKQEAISLISKDDRIKFLGWKNSNELFDIIAASDLYLQPGSQSATMQNSLCLGTPVLISNAKSHDFYNQGCAFVINDEKEIIEIFNEISNNTNKLKIMSDSAVEFSNKFLDYKMLANKYIG